MSWSKEHFKAIAYILGKHQCSPAVVREFTEFFKAHAQAFDQELFERAVEKFRRLPLKDVAVFRGGQA